MDNSTSNTPTVQIPLTQGYNAIVDVEDSDLISRHWYAYVDKTTCYAISHCGGRKAKRLRMHRIVMGRVLGRALLESELVDHKDNNGLNNCRSNLRLATNAQNGCNRGLQRNNTSGYKGVQKCKDKWKASIKVNKQVIYLGRFSDKHDAARAYNDAALKYHGEFACLNIISS